MTDPYLTLAERWRHRASDPFVTDDVSRAVEACADELEAEIAARRTERLNQREAAAAVGVDPSTIRRWEREKRLVRADPDGKALYRRCDVEAAHRGEPVDERTLRLIRARG